MVMGTPRMKKKKPLEYQYFPYLKKTADKYTVDTSIDISSANSTEIITHRIHMAINRL
jgi:hypothetical protein